MYKITLILSILCIFMQIKQFEAKNKKIFYGYRAYFKSLIHSNKRGHYET